MRHILNTVSEVTGVSVEDMLGKRRYREMADARMLAQYILRKDYQMPWRQMGKLFDCDHTNCVKNVDAMEDLLQYHTELSEAYTEIMTRLNPETIAA